MRKMNIMTIVAYSQKFWNCGIAISLFDIALVFFVLVCWRFTPAIRFLSNLKEVNEMAKRKKKESLKMARRKKNIRKQLSSFFFSDNL